MKRLGLMVASTVVAVGLAAAPAGAASTSNTKVHHAKAKAKAKGKKTKKTETTAQFAAQYEAIVAPANAAQQVETTAAKALPSAPTAAQLTPVVAPVIAAFQAMDSRLAAVKWPGQTEVDIRKMISDDGAVTGDLEAFESANAITASSVETKLEQDEGLISTDVDLVRADLGLPQASSG
jgi:hypothetical protein